MFRHEKQLSHSVEVERPNPRYAALLQEQLGGVTPEITAYAFARPPAEIWKRRICSSAGFCLSGHRMVQYPFFRVSAAVIFILLLVCTVRIEATDGTRTAIRRIVSEEILVAASPSAPLSNGQIVKLIKKEIPEG